jgi:serine/threonine protein kinase
LLGLEYIHTNNVIHRDIKPENLVLDEIGYLRITDFGVAKLFQKENSSETSGTPGYMAPEVMCAQNHSYVVDYFALGVIAYEFMFGVRPYLGKSRKEIKELIIAKQVQIRKQDIPEDWSVEAADFINKVFEIFYY